MQALGIKPKTSHVQQQKLEQHEMKQLLQRSGGGGPVGSDDEDDRHGKGLGYAPCGPGLDSFVLLKLVSHKQLPRTALVSW
jgi:hypothetical protein